MKSTQTFAMILMLTAAAGLANAQAATSSDDQDLLRGPAVTDNSSSDSKKSDAMQEIDVEKELEERPMQLSELIIAIRTLSSNNAGNLLKLTEDQQAKIKEICELIIAFAEEVGSTKVEVPEPPVADEKIVKADKKAEVVKAQELKTSNNLRALRVVVEGVESEVPITWIYYHVAEDDGRRVTYVFTLERNAIDRFGIADKLLVNETFFKSATETASRPVSGSTLQPRR